jgi:hypothetical protein
MRSDEEAPEQGELFASQASVASPKVFKAVRRHLGVPDRVLNVLVPEVVLQGPCVVPVVGEFEPTGMAKHVRVDRESHLGSLAAALDEAAGQRYFAAAFILS